MADNAGGTRATDLSSLHRYRTEIPNIIDDMELSVYAFRLYVRLKRVAGDNGKCFYSTRELAEQCRMSVGKVSDAKQELLARDLIRIENDGQWERDNITIVDMWPANFAYFAREMEPAACSPHEQKPEATCSPHEQTSPPPVHHMNTLFTTRTEPVHHMNTKEEPYKEITNKEEPKGERGRKAPSPPPSPEQDVDFGEGQKLNPKQTMYAAVCEAAGWDYHLIVEEDRIAAARLVSDLSKAGYAADDIRRFMTEVWFRDWRWEKNQQRPKLKDIRQGIGAIRLAPISATVPRASPTSKVAASLAAIDEYERIKSKHSTKGADPT